MRKICMSVADHSAKIHIRAELVSCSCRYIHITRWIDIDTSTHISIESKPSSYIICRSRTKLTTTDCIPIGALS